MEELFGVSMTTLMWVLLAITGSALGVVAVLAWRNPVMVKLGLRNIPRRPGQTALIIVGIMLSSIIMATAFGIGDTINHSIRTVAVESLGPIDEIVLSNRATSEDGFGFNPYFPMARFHELQAELADFDAVDGLAPGIGQNLPAINPRTDRSEGDLRVVGVDLNTVDSLGALSLTSGEVAQLETLGDGEAYLNDRAADELEAETGDQLQLFSSDEPLTLTVAGIVERGGLAGDAPTLVLPLEAAQELFERPGEINSIVVSNRGDTVSGVDRSEEVTERLRVFFADRAVASQLQTLLSQEEPLQALVGSEATLDESDQQELQQLRTELTRDGTSDRLVSLLADSDVSDAVLAALGEAELQETQREADTLFASLAEFRVLEIKREILEAAELVSSFVTTFFITLGLFSIMVGVLLIFLIFVMLAAARRSEMGMARAVGAKRRHLVQMFLFEGITYSVVAAAVGVAIGLAVSTLIITLVNQAIGIVESDFSFTRHFEPRSIVVAYCLGIAITFATVAVSAYRVSRLNIVAAIRDTPTPISITTRSWRELLVAPLRALGRPFVLGGRALRALAHARVRQALGLLLQMLWAIASIPMVFYSSIAQALWRPFTSGWLAFLLGAVVAWQGVELNQAAPFTIGVSLAVVGIGLMIRTLLKRRDLRAEVRDRIAYTFMGIVLLLFWLLPFDTLESLTGELDSNFEMFFVSGIAVVAAAVWTVMYNSDLLLRGLTFAAGRFGRLRPVLVTAVAYPMSSKFRTGLTLAMFALVIFTLIVMSILTKVFDVSNVDQEEVTGGWDIQGDVNFTTPIPDIRQAIADSPDLRNEDFVAIGGYTTVPVQVRQTDAEDQLWEGYVVRAVDSDFLTENGYQLKLIADGYGPTEQDVWRAMREDPSLVVVDALIVPRSAGGFEGGQISFRLEGLFYEDEEMSPIPIEIREPRTDVTASLTVIGVLDQLTDSFGELGVGMLVPKARVDDAVPFPIPLTTYRFRMAEGVDQAAAARGLETAFQQNGMETVVLAEQIEQNASANRAFNRIFTGYMALGLMVGVAALGVISLRAVVERRQQIGVLRAIGYRRVMIQLSFLLESSFVALLGIAIGVGLGTAISYNIVSDVQETAPTLRFSVPWVQIGAIIAIAYVFSLLTTFLPARQASRIYPAEALRYE